MLERIRPRRIEMWEFFSENVEAAGIPYLGGLAELGAGDRKAAEFFIAALRGCRRMLDIGCGEGLPALYLAERVGTVVGLDAAPNMIAAARANASRLGLASVSFEVGGLEALPLVTTSSTEPRSAAPWRAWTGQMCGARLLRSGECWSLVAGWPSWSRTGAIF